MALSPRNRASYRIRDLHQVGEMRRQDRFGAPAVRRRRYAERAAPLGIGLHQPPAPCAWCSRQFGRAAHADVMLPRQAAAVSL
jgi:hypothetical protein